jgi:hypothetical protein
VGGNGKGGNGQGPCRDTHGCLLAPAAAACTGGARPVGMAVSRQQPPWPLDAAAAASACCGVPFHALRSRRVG